MSRRSVADLEDTLARVYGAKLDVSPWLPGKDAEPEAWLSAAEQIGRAIGDRTPAPVVDRGWLALPSRPIDPPTPERRRSALDRQLAWARAAGIEWNGVTFDVD